MGLMTFDYPALSRRARQVLMDEFGPNAAVRTDEGEGGRIYVRIVSDRFDNMAEREKQTLVWDVLRRDLQAEAQAVAIVLPLGTDQI